ncbi:phosphorylated CTD interacting factor 1 WW domain-containing protein, partial [Baffinella frigidus]
MEVNADHLAKLRALAAHAGTHGGGAASSSPEGDELDGEEAGAVFALLARYSSFQGSHYRAGGFQAAIHGACFDVLLTEFGCALECFASPMNARYARFCSAHPATDAAFGSLGSFFQFKPTSGSFESNPPFDDATISKMVLHMESLLKGAKGPMSFAIIIPFLPDQVGWTRVQASRYSRGHLLVPQGEHGYFEGSQHDRITRFRVAPFDTSVFFLQNDSGFQTWAPTPDRLAKLKEGF